MAHLCDFYMTILLLHFTLEETVDADLAAVGVEGDDKEAGDRGVYHYTRHSLVGDEVGVSTIYRLIR